MCVFVCLYVESVSRSKDYVWSGIKIGSVLCLCTPASQCVPEMWGIYSTGTHLFLFFFVCVCVENVPLVEFMYLLFTSMPGESYRRRLRSLLLCLCDVFRALINSLVC